MAKLYLNPSQGIKSYSNRWYKHIEILGSGGNAITALVISTDKNYRGTLFALKIFKKLAEPKRRQRFFDETKFLRDNDHPSIMKVFDTGEYKFNWDGEDQKYPFIVAEYLPKTLSDVIREGQTTLVEKISYIIQLISALDTIHSLENPVIHRDIKPDNIFVKGNSCVLGDFGLLKTISSESVADNDAYLDSLGGTIPWRYRSPDLVKYAKGEEDIGVGSDIFQAGLVASELFTGHIPTYPPEQMLGDVVMGSYPIIRGDLGKKIGFAIRDMIEMKPDKRMNANSLLNKWEKILWIAIENTQKLEGHAFKHRG